MELKLAVQKLCGMMGDGAPLNGMCGPVSKLTAHMTINSCDLMATDWNQYDYAMQLYKIRDFVVTL